MANDQSEIPLVGQIEGAGLQLLVSRTAGADRRIEDWIASNLDVESDPSEDESLESVDRESAHEPRHAHGGAA